MQFSRDGVTGRERWETRKNPTDRSGREPTGRCGESCCCWQALDSWGPPSLSGPCARAIGGAESFYAVGIELHEAGYHQRALAEFRNAVRLDPENARYHEAAAMAAWEVPALRDEAVGAAEEAWNRGTENPGPAPDPRHQVRAGDW